VERRGELVKGDTIMTVESDIQQQRMIQLMGQMPQYNDGEGYDDLVATVDFNLSAHPNPTKARRQNIKRAIKALKPTKRSSFSPKRYWFGGKYVYHRAFQCCVDGTNCTNADYGDLFDQYFRDPYTLQVKPFRGWTGVISNRGRQLDSTYCPQHMMLYHNLMEWIEQEQAEANPNIFSRLAKRGVAFVPIKRHKEEEPEHPLIIKYTPVFIEAQKDGLPIMHYKNPGTLCPNCGHHFGVGENDLTFIGFDNRALQHTAPIGTKLSAMDMNQYHAVIEEMSKN
jgi:hypothetical protein